MNTEDKTELIGQLIDILEDFLEEQKPDLQKTAPFITGSGYDILSKQFEECLKNWKIV